MLLLDDLKSYIDDAHGDGYDTVELPIDEARRIHEALKMTISALENIANFGEDRPDAYPLMNIANEVLQDIGEGGIE